MEWAGSVWDSTCDGLVQFGISSMSSDARCLSVCLISTGKCNLAAACYSLTAGFVWVWFETANQFGLARFFRHAVRCGEV